MWALSPGVVIYCKALGVSCGLEFSATRIPPLRGPTDMAKAICIILCDILCDILGWQYALRRGSK